MRWKSIVPLVLTAMGMHCPVAEAHLVTTGFGPFYDGATHLALSPDDWLGLIAAGLLAGLCGARASRWTLTVLPGTWLLGAMAGLLVERTPALPGVSILSFTALGVLVALDAKLPVWGVISLSGLFGLLHGLLNGTSVSQANGSVLNVIGIVATAYVVLLLVSAAVVSLRKAWTRVAVRVAGSWIVAVGILMFGWLFRAAAGES